MSSLGVHAIYKLLNSYSNIVCERVFWEKESKDKRVPPLSIETGRPLSDFAVLAFSVTYELDYFNIPKILAAAGIPVYANERDERHPVIVAGGPCITANPAPVLPFFDAVAIGEAEPVLPPLIAILSQNTDLSRHELLSKLAEIPGIYVPEYSGKPVIRQFESNLDDFPVSTVVFTEDTEFGDMFMIEAQRGCRWGCRFCLVYNTFYPMRFHSLNTILSQAEEGLKHRKHIGLVGPDISDYPHLEELVTKLSGIGAEISVSSLRVKPFRPAVLQELVKSGAKTITIAPEAGSDRLCQMINKGINRKDVLQAVSHVAEEKVRQLKLYFMIGLPTETEDDTREIASLVLDCKAILDRGQAGTRLSLTVSPFIPKAGTPFERLPMAPLDAINERISILKRSLIPKGIEVKAESPAWSEVQAVLSRGDKTLSQVIVDTDELSLAGWRKAVAKNGLDTDYYAHSLWKPDRKIPWDFIDLNVKGKAG